MKTLFLLLFIGFSSVVNAQTFDEIFQQYLTSQKKQNNYQTDVRFALYKGVSGQKAYESYTGHKAVLDQSSYMKLGPTEFVVGKDFYIKLNTSEKAILFSNTFQGSTANPTQVDFEKIRTYIKEKALTDLGNQWKLEFNLKNISAIGYSKLELYLDKQSLRPLKQVAYMAHLYDFALLDQELLSEDQRTDIPRIEVVYSNFTKTIKMDKKRFTKAYYVAEYKGEFQPSDRFETFELIPFQDKL